MAAIKIIGSIVASCAIASVCSNLISQQKIFGGKTPKTTTKEWEQATERMYSAWPRSVGSPVVMNPITRGNYIVKSPSD